MTLRKFQFLFCVSLLLGFSSWPQIPVGSANDVQKGAPNISYETRSTDEHAKMRMPSAYSGVPIVTEFRPNEPANPQREARDRYYASTGRGGAAWTVEDRGQLVNGAPETLAARFVDFIMVKDPKATLTEPWGLPVAESDVIAIGTVLSGNCVVSAQHDAVYTDYTIRLDEILKNAAVPPVTVSQEVVGTRYGGAVHFPSGHITNYMIFGWGFPKLGSQYVFFLAKHVPGAAEYDIGLAYELKSDGRVYSLDDYTSKYTLFEKSEFLEQINKLLAKAVQERRQP
jgi:hypothetical protein